MEERIPHQTLPFTSRSAACAGVGRSIREGRRLLDAARVECARIVREATEHAEIMQAEAAAEGRARGEKAAVQLLFECGQREEALIAQARAEIIQAAVLLCRTLLGESISFSSEVLEHRLIHVLREVPGSFLLRLFCNPSDAPSLAAIAARSSERRGRRISVHDDPSLPRGALRVESRYGVVESTLAAHLEALERYLVEQCTNDSAA